MSSGLRFLGYIVTLVKKVVSFIYVEAIAVCSFDNPRIRGCFMSRCSLANADRAHPKRFG